MKSIVICLAAALAACGGSEPVATGPNTGGAGSLSPDDIAVLNACAKTFEGIPSSFGPGLRSQEWLFLLAEWCLPDCNYNDGTIPSHRMETMAAAAAKCAPGASPGVSWFLANKIIEWISLRRQRGASAHPELFARLDEAMEGQRFRLALDSSADGLELIKRDSLGRTHNSLYVVVTESGISAGVAGVATFAAGGVKRALPGGEFPGTKVALAELPGRLSSYLKAIGVELEPDARDDGPQETSGAPMLLVARQVRARRIRDVVRAIGEAGFGIDSHGFAVEMSFLTFSATEKGDEVRFAPGRVLVTAGGTTAKVEHIDGAIDWKRLVDELAKLEGDDPVSVVFDFDTIAADFITLIAVLAKAGRVAIVLREDPPIDPSVAIGDVTNEPVPTGAKTGTLDKAIIGRYIRRSLGKIKFCYERDLQKDPSLTGTVVVRFVIAANGKVASSVGSGMAKVDSCVAAVIKAIYFPKPKGGGSVSVTYPFVFRSS